MLLQFLVKLFSKLSEDQRQVQVHEGFDIYGHHRVVAPLTTLPTPLHPPKPAAGLSMSKKTTPAPLPNP